MFTLIWTSHFTRTAHKFLQRHPVLKKKFINILKDLVADPFQSSLKLRPLSGELKGLHTISLTYSYRITLMLKVTAKEIVLLDVGNHDEEYE